MGGMNCHLPRPTRPVVKPTDLRNAGTEYAAILKNIFSFSAYFSFANAKIETVMITENTQKNEALKSCYEALDDFRKSMNFAQTGLLLLEKFIKEVSTLERKPIEAERKSKLNIMAKELKKCVKYQQKLLVAYENSNISTHIKYGNLARIIRDNLVTTYTESLAKEMAELMIELREYSILDKKLESEMNVVYKKVI